MIVPAGKCHAIIFRPDVLRRTGRGKTGFEMHYNEDHCSRRAVLDTQFCWQHMFLVSKDWGFYK